ncbi:MAG TPA: PASTA domain-containing protein, partial [Micromonosporaceae bacterium]|nr:PASTA domain-containing protein [Micromonosporaceae bacterium]
IARLTHPNVVAVYDQGTHDGLPYLVMEYVRGRTLRDMLTDTRRLGPGESLAILEQMLAAIAAAHRAGVIHRDVKPENVLVATSPTGGSLVDAVVKVADFGLAQAVEASAEEGDGQLLATVAYVAPELVTEGRADTRTDVYSVGIVLFEMLTGRVPYDGPKPIDVAWCHVDQDVPPPSKYVPGLPPELDEIVAHATRRDPDLRPVDAGALLTEVQSAHERVDQLPGFFTPTVASPTVGLETLGSEQDRPSWSRLPASRTAGGRRRADTRATTGTRTLPRSRGAAVASPGPGDRVAQFTSWFQGVMSRRNGRRTFYATLGLLALLVVVGGWWLGAGRYTSTPTMVGKTQQQAVASAKKLGFELKYAAGTFSEKVPKDTVLKQDPAADSRILRGGTITLTLSLGPERYAIPDDAGKPFETTKSDLVSIKMVIKRVDQYSDELPAGTVISLNPKAGTLEPPGTEVTVTVSKGKAPITVPNVVGQPFDAANATLTGLGLTVAQTPKASTTVPAGSVISQSLPQGAGAVNGQTIILTVSTGPPSAPVPDVSNKGYTFDQASQILKQAGFQAVLVADFPGGQVRFQSPTAGTSVPLGTQVQLWVAP